MSIPLRITPRPVKKLRAAPTAKCDTIAIVNASQMAARPCSTRNGKNRNEGADRGRHPGDPPLAERRRVRLTDLQLVPHLLAQRAHRIAHHFLRHAPRRTPVHAFRFVLQRHLFHLDFRHQANLFLLHCDLVLPHLLLAFRGQIAGRPHRQCVRERAGHARDQDHVRLQPPRRSRPPPTQNSPSARR